MTWNAAFNERMEKLNLLLLYKANNLNLIDSTQILAVKIIQFLIKLKYVSLF